MYDYFYNLKNYLPENWKGTCSYVGLIGVLSYYDTILNDNLIPNNFNNELQSYSTYQDFVYNSPGVNREDYSSTSTEMQAFGLDGCYENYIDYTYNSSFQSYLIKQYNNNILNRYYDNSNHNETKYDFSFGVDKYQTLLNLIYGNNEIQVVNEYISFDNAIKPRYRNSSLNTIKEYIDDGVPVIVGLMSENFHYDEEGNKVYEGHIVIAYDYDNDGNIYANYGYNNVLRTRKPLFTYDEFGNINSEYNRIMSITTLNFNNLTHVHSDKYLINGINYCSCGQHIHDINYSALNCFEHVAQCCCGYIEIGTHNHTSDHNLSCNECDIIFDSYTPTSSILNSSIDNFSIDFLVGSYGLKDHIYLKIDYVWDVIPEQKFIDYIVLAWSYKYELGDEFLASNYYGNTLNEVFNNFVDAHNYGSMFKEIYWTFDLTDNLNDIPKGTALIKLDYKSGYDISFNVRYYHVSFTAAAIKGIYLDSNNMYTTDSFQVHNITCNYSL